VEVTAANVHDGAAAPALMEQNERRGLKPEAYVGDMAYSTAELREHAAERGTEMVARVPPASSPTGCFSKDDFSVDLEAGSVTCPAGQTTRQMYRRASGGSTLYFDGKVCAACPLRTACTRQDPEVMRRKGRGRNIQLHPLEATLQRARALEGTDRVQGLLKQRPLVERRLAHLMSGRGRLRQARYRGPAKTQFQALAAALVVNLVRMANLLPHPALSAPQRERLRAQIAATILLMTWVGTISRNTDPLLGARSRRPASRPFRSVS
jgi:IS5 family transposase